MKSLILWISNSCFVNCPWCYNHFEEERIIRKDLILKFMSELKQILDIDKVTISWWDPLSRDDILDIISNIYDIWFKKINLDTVWIPIVRDTITIRWEKKIIKKINIKEFAKYINFLWIPIDWSSNKIIHEYRKGIEKIMNDIYNILNECDNYKIKVCINTVVSNKNYNDLNNIADIIKNFECIKKRQLFQFIPTWPINKKTIEKFIINDDIFMNEISKITDYTKSKWINIEAKSYKKRKNKYLIIDSSWNAWDPDDTNHWKKKIIGNISINKDHYKIIKSIENW